MRETVNEPPTGSAPPGPGGGLRIVIVNYRSARADARLPGVAGASGRRAAGLARRGHRQRLRGWLGRAPGGGGGRAGLVILGRGPAAADQRRLRLRQQRGDPAGPGRAQPAALSPAAQPRYGRPPRGPRRPGRLPRRPPARSASPAAGWRTPTARRRSRRSAFRRPSGSSRGAWAGPGHPAAAALGRPGDADRRAVAADRLGGRGQHDRAPRGLRGRRPARRGVLHVLRGGRLLPADPRAGWPTAGTCRPRGSCTSSGGVSGISRTADAVQPRRPRVLVRGASAVLPSARRGGGQGAGRRGLGRRLRRAACPASAAGPALAGASRRTCSGTSSATTLTPVRTGPVPPGVGGRCRDEPAPHPRRWPGPRGRRGDARRPPAAEPGRHATRTRRGSACWPCCARICAPTAATRSSRASGPSPCTASATGGWGCGRPFRAPLTLLYRSLFKGVEWTCGITLPYTVRLGRRVRIWHHGGMVLHARSIGDDVQIRQNTTFGVARADRRLEIPTIEAGADIGCGACILGDVVVGRRQPRSGPTPWSCATCRRGRRPWGSRPGSWCLGRRGRRAGHERPGHRGGRPQRGARRLIACLESVVGRAGRLVYVDSGSTDGSIGAAPALGAEVVELDGTAPFTAARARNAGFGRLLERSPRRSRYVQFVDGDCEVADGWIERRRAEAWRRGPAAWPSPAAGAGSGTRRRRSTTAWPTWSGAPPSVDARGPTAAATPDGPRRGPEPVGGFDPGLDRRRGARPLRPAAGLWLEVLRLDAEMTGHDAAMTRFGQWWRRNIRAGYVYAEGAARHGRRPGRPGVRQASSNWLWGLVLPAAAAGLAWPTRGLSLLCLARLPTDRLAAAAGRARRGASIGHAGLSAPPAPWARCPRRSASSATSRPAGGPPSALIEYKGDAPPDAVGAAAPGGPRPWRGPRPRPQGRPPEAPQMIISQTPFRVSFAGGGINYIRFNPDDTVDVEPVPCGRGPRGAGATHAAALHRPDPRRQRDPPAAVRRHRRPDDVLRQMRDLADQMRRALAGVGDLDSFAALLHEGWELKRSLGFGITTGRIDEWYEAARRTARRGQAAGGRRRRVPAADGPALAAPRHPRGAGPPPRADLPRRPPRQPKHLHPQLTR